MRVKCRSNKDSFLMEYSNITVGEIYNVIAFGKDYSMGTDVYTVTDDNGLYFTHGISLFTLIKEDKMDQVRIIRKLEDLDGLENGMGAELIYVVVGGSVKVVTSEDELTINSSDGYSDIESFLDTLKAMGFKFEYKPLRTEREVFEEIKNLEGVEFKPYEENFCVEFDYSKQSYGVASYGKYRAVGVVFMASKQAQKYAGELNEIIANNK
ncbi:MAG: hypothetical protein ACRCX2_35310 [Paraclostridium sp.]